MSWTKSQKQTAIIACRNAGIDEDHRELILRQFPHAMHKGRITSTSPALSNTDFEQFMAIIERTAGGELPKFTMHYWQKKAEDHLARMRSLALALNQQLEATGNLEPNCVGLAGWIRRMTHGEKEILADLDYHELYKVIEGLKVYANRRGVRMEV